MIQRILLYIVAWIIVTVIHEFGHGFHYYSIKKRWPKFKVTWYNVSAQIKGDITPSQKITNCIVAFLFGFLVVVIIDLKFLYWLYFIGCIIDFIIIIANFIVGFKYGFNKQLDEIR